MFEGLHNTYLEGLQVVRTLNQGSSNNEACTSKESRSQVNGLNDNVEVF